MDLIYKEISIYSKIDGMFVTIKIDWLKSIHDLKLASLVFKERKKLNLEDLDGKVPNSIKSVADQYCICTSIKECDDDSKIMFNFSNNDRFYLRYRGFYSILNPFNDFEEYVTDLKDWVYGNKMVKEKKD